MDYGINPYQRMDCGHGLVILDGIQMKLRYSISPKSQILYIHSRDPQMLYVEWDADYPHIWVECNNSDHHYPRKIEVHNTTKGSYQGKGSLIPNKVDSSWQFYDCGPSTTEEFNQARLPNVAPYNYQQRKTNEDL